MAELCPGAGRGGGATLIGARVTLIWGGCWEDGADGSHWLPPVYTGGLAGSAGGGGGGGGGGGNGGGAGGVDSTWVSVGCALDGAGAALVEASGTTLVDSSSAPPGIRMISRPTAATAATAAATTSAFLVRYHGGAGALKLSERKLSAKSEPIGRGRKT